MPEVPRHQTQSQALGLRSLDEKCVHLIRTRWSLRLLRRSARSRRLLSPRHELGRWLQIAQPPNRLRIQSRNSRYSPVVTPVTFAFRILLPNLLPGGFTMDRRRQSRVFVDIPVHIWGMDANSRPFSAPASLRTISGRGATLQGVDVQLKPGELLDLQYQGSKAQFRIVWLGKPGTEMQGEVGLESLASELRLWDIDPLRCAAAVGRG